jgi:hypothetical protein
MTISSADADGVRTAFAAIGLPSTSAATTMGEGRWLSTAAVNMTPVNAERRLCQWIIAPVATSFRAWQGGASVV